MEFLLDKNSFLLVFFRPPELQHPLEVGMIRNSEFRFDFYRLEAMSKFSFCYHTVTLNKGKPMEGFQEKKQNENLWSRECIDTLWSSKKKF